jgi:hypothetical protein
MRRKNTFCRLMTFLCKIINHLNMYIKKSFLLLFLLFASLITAIKSYGQVSITTASYSQNFNSMSGSTLPTGWQINSSGSTTQSATSLNGTSSGGAYVFTNSGDKTIGILNSGSYSSGKTVTFSFTNNTGGTIKSIYLSFDYRKFRTGTREFTWTLAGSSGTVPSSLGQVFAADGSTGTSIFPGQSTADTGTITGLNIANAATYTLTWTLTGTGGSSNGQALGIDNFNLCFTTITAQPTTPTATCPGNGVQNISVTAIGSGLSYSWRKGGVALTNGGVISGQGTSTLTLTNPTSSDAGSYNVIVTGTCGDNLAVVSNSVTVSILSTPTITVAPVAPSAVCAGSGTRSISVTATGSSLTYTWKKSSGTTVVNGSGISGQGTSTLTFTNPSYSDSGSYYVVVSNACSPSDSSSAVNVIINKAPTIDVQPSTGTQTVVVNNALADISASASGLGLSYQWYSNTVASNSGGVSLGAANGAQTNVYTPQATVPGVTYYYVIVSGSCTPAATSNVTGAITVTRDTYYLTANDATVDANWNSLANGLGATIGGIASTTYSDLIIDDETAAFVNTNVTLATGSKYIVSQGVAAKLTVNDATLTGTVDVGTAGSLELLVDNTQLSAIALGTLSTGSEVIYSNTGNQNIIAATYSSLTTGGTGTKSLAGNVGVNEILTLAAGADFAINNQTLTLGGTIAGTGAITGGAASNLVINGTGSLGTITMDATTPGTTNLINNLTLNRTAAGTATMGNSLVVGGALTLTSGILDINDNTLTLNGTTSGSGTLKGSTTSNINIGGTGAMGTILMDATTPTTTNALNDLTYNRTGGGSFTLGNTFNIYGVVTHTAGTMTTNGNLVLKATDATTYGQVAGTGTGVISGTLTSEFMITGGGTGWRPICSPVNGATLAQLNDNFNLDFGKVKAAAANVYYFDESAAPYWNIASDTTASMDNHTYSIYMGGAAAWENPVPVTMDITGTYAGTADYTVSGLTRTGSIADTTGWQVIRNPWPSAFLWDGTATTVDDVANVQGQQVWVFSQTDSGYLVFDNATPGAVPPYTPFTLQVVSNNTNLTFKNSARNTDSMANYFSKTGLENLVALTVTGPTGKTDVVTLYTQPQATNGYDIYDGTKKLNTGAPNMYFMLEGKKANKEVWNTLPEANQPVFIHFFDKNYGTHTIDFATENMAPGIEITLEDLVTGTMHKIGTPYVFNYDANSPQARFVLHFGSNKTATTNKPAPQNLIQTGSNGSNVTLIINKAGSFDATVFDLLGRPVSTPQTVQGSAQLNTINLSGLAAGYYLLQVQGEGIAKTEKIYIQ